MVTERLLIRDCSCFTDYEKMNRDNSVIETVHSLLDLAYINDKCGGYNIDIDFYTKDSADRFESMIHDYGLLTLKGSKMVRFCIASFRLSFICSERGLFMNPGK